MPEGETEPGRLQAPVPAETLLTMACKHGKRGNCVLCAAEWHAGFTVAGMDPGKTGAMVIVFPDGSTAVHRVPLMKLRGKERPAWTEWQANWATALELACPDLIVIEEVAARPGQGVTSMFNFGQALGFIRAIAAGAKCPVESVTPSVWKGKLGLLKSDKNASREIARRLMPSLAPAITRVKDDGVAEAALLAYYGRQHHS